MGLLSIGMAFLVANLGTLFQVAYSISGALVSPMDGLFLTGIVAPWVNAKVSVDDFRMILFYVYRRLSDGWNESVVLVVSKVSG